MRRRLSLVTLGVRDKIEREPADAFWGGYTLIVIDPDGGIRLG